MSKLETNTIDTISGTSNLTIGSTNSSTVTFENGAATGHMYPAFEAYLSADQTLTNNVATLVQFDTEVFDTDSAFDNTATNYKFTVPSGQDGKYYIFSRLAFSSGAVSNLNYNDLGIYLNGSAIGRIASQFQNNDVYNAPEEISMILDLSAGDYIQVYGRLNINSGTPSIVSGGGASRILDSVFGAYRIGA